MHAQGYRNSVSENSTALGLFVTHRAALVEYANSIIGSRAQAEDLVQEAWLRFDEASRGRLLDDAKGYLYRIVRNLAVDQHRRHARERRLISARGLEPAIEARADDSPSPETIALYRDEIRLVMDAMAELPERTRIAFEMHRFGGATLKEIAGFLGISVSLAQILVTDAAEHCKERLAKR
ncbi:MAG: sigma-70 family RNA polymerase sigma factor [Pseudomonadota bacterium]